MSGTEIQPVKICSISEKKRVSLCVGCGGQIHDQYILRVAPDLEWHANCLKCAECSQSLDETCTCFVRDGKTYCKNDYTRLFGTKCSKCSEGFSKNDFVMRAKNKIYHIDCFRCVACSRQLIPGDEFAMRDDGLFCKSDHDVVERATHNNNNNNNVISQNGECPMEDTKSSFNNNNNETKGTTLLSPGNENSNSSTTGSRSGDAPPSSGHGHGHGHGHGGRGRGHKSDQKTTRIRTVLNEKQLHTLRTCYNANPRPDALMKEQLVEMTSLSPRVIRVWFQNKRCKDKKKSILMKQIQQQHQEKGVPMVASSPVRHEPPPNMQHNPVEVQQYQAPWKALSEFALQSELDQPPFQQLMNSFDMPHGCHPEHCMSAPHDMYVIDDFAHGHGPNSVSSENTLPGTPSELSSPLSQ